MSDKLLLGVSFGLAFTNILLAVFAPSLWIMAIAQVLLAWMTYDLTKESTQ